MMLSCILMYNRSDLFSTYMISSIHQILIFKNLKGFGFFVLVWFGLVVAHCGTN